MLSRKAKHLACVAEILRFAQNDIHHVERKYMKSGGGNGYE